MEKRDRDSGRKYLSGNKKRKLARKQENSIAFEKGALDKFFKWNLNTNQQKETLPHQNAVDYQPCTEEPRASQQIIVQPGAIQQITEQLSFIDNNVGKKDLMTLADTVLDT